MSPETTTRPSQRATSPKGRLDAADMTALAPWLGKVIEREVDLASLWKRIGIDSNGFLNDADALARRDPTLREQIDQVRRRHDSGDFDPDEDRFSITKTNSDHQCLPVQLVRLLKKSAPVQAILSDGETLVHVKFKAQSLQAFHKKHSRSFTESPDGCLLRLLTFKILATTHGSPHDQVSLLIVDFDYLGLPQLPIGRPLALLDHSGIKAALDSLLGTVTPAGDDMAVEDNGDTHEFNAPPSPHSIASQIDDSSTEIGGFETQLPFGTDSVPVLRSEGVNFLSFISKKPKQAPSAGQNVTPRLPLLSAARPPDAVGDTTHAIEEPLPATAAQESLSGHQVHHDEVLSSEALVRPSSKYGETQNVESKPAESIPAQGEVLASQRGPGEEDQQDEKSRPYAAIKDVWAGMTFPLGDVSVPEDQQAILARPHSWYPADPGKTFPAGNVPLAVLQWAEQQGQQAAHLSADVVQPDAADADTQAGAIRNEEMTSAQDDDEGNVSEASEGTQFTWDESSLGGHEEDDSKSSIDPTPVMPSPLKPSPAKTRLVLPPDSSAPSPQPPPKRQRVALPPDSDDDMMAYEEPHAQTDVQSADLHTTTLPNSAAAVRSCPTPTKAANAQSITSLEGTGSSPAHPLENDLGVHASTPKPFADQTDVARSVSSDSMSDYNSCESHHEGSLYAVEVYNSRGSPRRHLADVAPQVSVEHGPVLNGKVLKNKDARASPDVVEELTEQLPSHTEGTDKSTTAPKAAEQGHRKSSPQAIQHRRHSHVHALASSLGQPGHELQGAETEERPSSAVAVDQLTFVQSTYPERSAQKRRPSVVDPESPSPKRAKHSTRRYGFSQDSPVSKDYRKENQREKLEFLRQLRRTRAAALEPSAEELHGVNRTPEFESDEADPGADRGSVNAVLEASSAGSGIPHGRYPLQAAKTRAHPGRVQGNDPNLRANVGARRQLPWTRLQGSSGRPTSSYLSSSPPRVASPQQPTGWRQRSRDMLLSSRPSSPQQGSRPPSASDSVVLQRRKSASLAPRGDAKAGVASFPIDLPASARPPGPSSLTRDPAAYNDAVSRRALHEQPQAAQLGQTAPSKGPDQEVPQPQVDGPVVDLHKEFQKLKSVARDLELDSDTDADGQELKRRHPRRWGVLGWSL